MNRNLLVAIPALLLALGVGLGLAPVHAGSVGCGAVWNPSSEARVLDGAEQFSAALSGGTPDLNPTNNQDACNSALSSRRIPTYGALGLAVIAVIAIAVTPGRRERSGAAL